MAKKTAQSSILIDFLLVVIITVTMMLSILTYFNILDKKTSVLAEVSNNSGYIATVLEEIGRDAILRENTLHFDETVNSLTSHNNETFYEIILYKLIDDKTLKIIYSSKKENIGKKAVVNNVEEYFKNTDVNQGEMVHENIHTYDYINIIRSNHKIIGTINVITSLKKIDAQNTKNLIINLVITVISILLIIGLTTIMLLNRIYNPVKKLIEEVRRIKEGEVAYEVSIKVNNELSLLADEINEMKSVIWANNMDSSFANHTTGLPTLIAAVESIADKMYNNQKFGIVSFSIRGYDGFILGYGINKWEEILRMFVHMLNESVDGKMITGHTLAHIKDNQILFIGESDEVEEAANDILKQFDSAINDYYNEADKTAGAIILKDSIGNEVIMPKMTMLAVVIKDDVIQNEVKNYKNVEEIITIMEIDYQELKESSRVVVYEGNKKKDNLVETVGEKIKDNIEPVSTEKENEDEIVGNLELN